MKQTAIRLARLGPVLAVRRKVFPGSEHYWESRYAKGGTSGAGSYGAEAEWKATVVNGWVAEHEIDSVIDWGCGDGNQLTMARYPRYLGIDRSQSAIKRCIEQFGQDPDKSFMAYSPESLTDNAGWLTADAALSMEVIFHLTEETVYLDYMSRLFASARRWVVICSNDTMGTESGPTERHWQFTDWIASNAGRWSLQEVVEPPSNIALMSKLYLFSRAA